MRKVVIVMKDGTIASEIDNYNKRCKKELEIRKCLKCRNFDRTVYQCKIKKCDKI